VERLITPVLAAGTLAAPGAELVLVEWTAPPGPPGAPRHIAPLHVHHADDEAWYVLEGALRFRLGDDELEASAGGAVLAPRGTPHTYWNPGTVPARYLLVLTPRLRRLIDALHSDPADMDAVFRAHDSESLGWL
jgi:mannose-6-phosphate isomerase-like protein (cupin superfamily)